MCICVLEVNSGLLRSIVKGGLKQVENGPLGLSAVELQGPSWSPTAPSVLSSVWSRPQRLTLFLSVVLLGAAPRVFILKPGSG